MATSTYGTPYVQGSDLVSAYPTVSSSLATRVDEVSYRGNGLNAQTATTYTLVVGDAGKTITLSNASPVAVTLPQDSTADLPDGAVVTFYNLGAGTVTISQGTGATLQGGSITLVQYEVMSVIKLSANTYGRFDGGGGAGLAPATPTSIANSGGTATLSGNTVTFSGVTSVSLNGCFTSTYANYRIVTQGVALALAVMRMRLRAAGSDLTGANYSYGVGGWDSAGGSASYGGGSQTSFGFPYVSTLRYGWGIDIISPQLTQFTQIVGTAQGINAADTAYVGASVGGAFFLTTAVDGLTIFPSTSSISGTIAVYGYKN